MTICDGARWAGHTAFFGVEGAIEPSGAAPQGVAMREPTRVYPSELGALFEREQTDLWQDTGVADGDQQGAGNRHAHRRSHGTIARRRAAVKDW